MAEVMQAVPWILAAWTVATMWLAGNKNPLAWWSGIASQALWLVFDYHVEAWGLMPLAVVLTYVYARNLLKWRREQEATVTATYGEPIETLKQWTCTKCGGRTIPSIGKALSLCCLAPTATKE